MSRKVRTYTLRLPRAATAEGKRAASLSDVLKPGKGWNVADLMAEWHRLHAPLAGFSAGSKQTASGNLAEVFFAKTEQAERAPSQKKRRARRAP
jgi:hypothetical protein